MAINEEQQSDGFTYDVFFSFRGPDVRHGFMGYLREAFRKRRIKYFYDDKNMNIGDNLTDAFCKAIEESKISVIVLSENYATSGWCLNELAKIMECEKTKNQIVFPIFYYVQATDVRNQTKSYGKAMGDQQNKYGNEPEKIKAWRAALFDVANRKGHSIHTGFELEINHVKEIALKVHANVPTKPLIDGVDQVGFDQRIEKVKSLLDSMPNDDTVCMLSITGLPGIGKTKLATELYNKIVHQFEAASFLANVREKSNNINGQEKLQKTLLSEMFEQPETKLGSTSRGNCEIKDKLGMKKVLLVLDDIDNIEQLKNLAGGFGPGSRIIITTKDKTLLKCPHLIKFEAASSEKIEVVTYPMTTLNGDHSLELFCQEAFGKRNPEEGFKALSLRAVRYAKGLPLALKVIGSNLAPHKSVKAWEDALTGYERTPPKDIQDVLKVSYNALERNAQSVFLDIACFFKGKRLDYVEEILEEFSAASKIEELVNKSLLNIDNGYLRMHDLIQEMGREVVMQEEPDNPANRSRLWLPDDVIEVLSANGSVTDKIQGIMLDPPKRITEVDLDDTAFEKMNRLRILIVKKTTFSSEPKHLPNHLRLLDWKRYPSQTFPSKFNPKKVIVLNLVISQLKMEVPFEKFSCVTVINLSNSKSITIMPNMSKVKKLRELRLDDCSNLTKVDESIGFLEHLVHLSASGCTELKHFPQKIFLPSLQVLNLGKCKNLERFPDIEGEMNSPLKIHMRATSIKKLPDSVGKLIGLVSIDMKSSKNLEYLPRSLFTLPNLVDFKLGECSLLLRESVQRSLLDSHPEANKHSTLETMEFCDSGLSDEHVEAILKCFPNLEELIVSRSNNLVSLPTCIKECNHLTKLVVKRCRKLQKIPECTNLRILNVRGCSSLAHISELPCTIQEIDARECFNLSSDTSHMLWELVKKERHGLEIVMPIYYNYKVKKRGRELENWLRRTEVPDWFNYRCIGGIPCLWICGKFPINVVLSLKFQAAGRKKSLDWDHVKLNFVINGQSVPQKYEVKICANHVLLCDLRLLYNDEEWLSIDALLKHDWNQVQISYEVMLSSFTLSEWGVFVYKQGRTDNLELEEHVQFMCPDPTRFSNFDNSIVPAREPMEDEIQTRDVIDEELKEILDDMNSEDESGEDQKENH